MLPDDNYRTISAVAKGYYKEKGSIFLAFACPVISEEEVKEKLTQLRKEYHDARHHCYAYRLGFDKPVFRINDDGEPSGTAGRPIYGQIVSHDITQVLVVVIRYFGGTKLGVSGLINAYKTTSKEALDEARIITKTIHEEYQIQFDYPVMNDVMKVLKDENITQSDQVFGLGCSIVINFRISAKENILKKFTLIENIKLTYIETR
jgi:uncharacterized YigZ family protein